MHPLIHFSSLLQGLMRQRTRPRQSVRILAPELMATNSTLVIYCEGWILPSLAASGLSWAPRTTKALGSGFCSSGLSSSALGGLG